ncbi:MAG: C40 family peptidase [Burkholderiales bacterium]|nr:C40 family peptidase [Burkholderiales bacterium]
MPRYRTRLASLLCALWVAAGAAQAAPDAPAPAEPAPQAEVTPATPPEQGLLPEAAALAAQVQASPIVQRVRDAASGLVVSSMNFIGVRYRRGGNSAAQGFDCSGFTRYVFEHSIGLVLPRRADQQAHDGALVAVQRSDLKPGDLVFFNTMRRAFSHVGIYIGEGKFIHAPRPGGEVRIEDINLAYWARRFSGARRAEMPDVPTPN